MYPEMPNTDYIADYLQGLDYIQHNGYKIKILKSRGKPTKQDHFDADLFEI